MTDRDNPQLLSTAFGVFDPDAPQPPAGPFARLIAAAAVDIDAPVATVWETLIDFERYPEWNPLNRFFHLDGRAEPNQGVTFGPCWGPYPSGAAALPPADMTTRETITVWEQNRCLAYAALGPLLKAERSQCLERLPDGRTRYRTYERLCGVMAPFVKWHFGARILAGFTANGVALKQRVEQVDVCA